VIAQVSNPQLQNNFTFSAYHKRKPLTAHNFHALQEWQTIFVDEVSMSLAIQSITGVAFDKSAIMHHAHNEARFALGLSRARFQSVSTRRAIFGRFLAKAWAAAKAEVATLARQAEQAAAIKVMLAERARQSVALVASYGGAEGVHQAIASETMRDRMNFAAVAKLETALSSIGAV
jgi:hypothetical protein